MRSILENFEENFSKHSNLYDNLILQSVEKDLNDISSFLMIEIDEFLELGDLLDFEILCNLLIPYSHAISLFNSYYYYKHKKDAANIDSWVAVLNRIIDKHFEFKLKQFLTYSCLELSQKEKYAAYGGFMYSIYRQIDLLAFSDIERTRLTLDEFIEQDKLLEKKLLQNQFEEVGDRIFIPI